MSRHDRPLLHLVTDRTRLTAAHAADHERLAALEAQLSAAIDAGIDVIQIRERGLDAGRLRAIAAAATQHAAGTATRIVVNDRADVAQAAGAHGVQLRGDGAAISRVRAAYPGLAIGRSVHAPDEARAHAGADYLLFGHVFASASKRDLAPAGVDGLRATVAAARGAVIAIGGIDAANARTCVEAGAAGVAAIGAFIPSAGRSARVHLARAVADLRAALENC